MSNQRGFMEKVENAYLQIFKVVILIVLTLALIASIILAVKGWNDLNAEAGTPPPGKEPSVTVEDFLKSITEQPAQPAPAKPKPAPGDAASDAAMDKRFEDMALKHAVLRWEHLSKCVGPDYSVPKPPAPNWDSFIAAHKSWLKSTLKIESQGEKAVTQFDALVSAVLPHQAANKWCQDNLEYLRNNSKKDIFLGARDFFDRSWEAQIKKNQRDAKEFSDKEAARVAAAKAAAMTQLIAAGSAFGVFMLLSLLLIFAKIEFNLRNARIDSR